MLLKSEAYKACIDYFVDNLFIFDNDDESANTDLIADIVIKNTANMLMSFCKQQPNLDKLTRNSVIVEGDKLIEELEHILGRLWKKPATQTQIEFLDEYFLLLKNSLDSQI
jgi:hypothetical protein